MKEKETEIEDEDSAYCRTLEINKGIKEEIDILSFYLLQTTQNSDSQYYKKNLIMKSM